MDDKKIINDFISTLSHEIRTPLTSIKGFAQTMYDNYDVLDDTQKKQFLKIMYNQSQRLINLVENVLNTVRLDSGKDNIILKEIDLPKIIQLTVDTLKISYKTHIFKMDFAKNIQTSIGDFDKLQQILVNIVENACKYSPEKSEINIRLFNLCDMNVIEIEDNGIGIEKKELDKIFDKFYRSGNVLTNKAQGSGLGLYIAKTLADKMNVKIEVESKTQKNSHGTKFKISIPVFEIERLTKTAKEKNV